MTQEEAEKYLRRAVKALVRVGRDLDAAPRRLGGGPCGQSYDAQLRNSTIAAPGAILNEIQLTLEHDLPDDVVAQAWCDLEDAE